MKVIKGLIIYSLILICVCTFAVALVFGLMFIIPGFSLFNWCVIKANTNGYTAGAGDNHGNFYLSSDGKNIGVACFAGSAENDDVNKFIPNRVNINVNAGGFNVNIITANDKEEAGAEDDYQNSFRVIQKNHGFGMVKKVKNPIDGTRKLPTLNMDVTYAGYNLDRLEEGKTLLESKVENITYPKTNNGLPSDAVERYILSDINVNIPEINSKLFFYKNCALDIYVPSKLFKNSYVQFEGDASNKVPTFSSDSKSLEYNLNIKTTKGNIETVASEQRDPAGSSVGMYSKPIRNVLNAKNLNLETTSGNINVKHFNVENYKDSKGNYIYDKKVELESLNVKTDSGICSLFVDEFATKDASKQLNVNNTVTLESKNGDFRLNKLYANVEVYGNNCKLSAVEIKTRNVDGVNKGFRFISKDGIFDVDSVITKGVAEDPIDPFSKDYVSNQPVIQIITESTDVNIKNVDTALYVKTTYGNINIDKCINNTKLVSEHGNIKINSAEGIIMATTTHGDITCLRNEKTQEGGFANKAKFTTINGKINVESAIDNVETLEIKSVKGPIKAKHILGPCNITSSDESPISVYFDGYLEKAKYIIASKNGLSRIYCPTYKHEFNYDFYRCGNEKCEHIFKVEKDKPVGNCPLCHRLKGDSVTGEYTTLTKIDKYKPALNIRIISKQKTEGRVSRIVEQNKWDKTKNDYTFTTYPVQVPENNKLIPVLDVDSRVVFDVLNKDVTNME